MWLFKKKRDLKIQDYDENTLYAPVNGKKVALENVDDPVFSQKIMGDGIAIIPESDEIYAPVSGKVEVVFPTKHAIGIESDNGASIILHIGIETVKLKGKGFDIKINQGDRIEAGKLIGIVDFDFVREQFDPTVIMVIENSENYTLKESEETMAYAGKCLIKLSK